MLLTSTPALSFAIRCRMRRGVLPFPIREFQFLKEGFL